MQGSTSSDVVQRALEGTDAEDPRVRGVLRVLSGADLDDVAADLAVDAEVLSRWVSTFVAGGRDRLVHREIPDLTARADRLLALVAHELRTPVSVIRGWLRVLDEHVDDSEEVQAALGEVNDATGRLQRMVDDLLDTTAASLGRYRFAPAQLDLGELVTSVVDGDDAIRLRVDGTDLTVSGDQDGIRRVVSRLVAGARLGQSRAPLDLGVSAVADWVEVRVTRRGLQLPFETVHAMLEPFEAPPHRPVPSLGLYMARAVTVAHHGYLGARGTEEGTCFWIRLPRATEEGTS